MGTATTKVEAPDVDSSYLQQTLEKAKERMEQAQQRLRQLEAERSSMVDAMDGAIQRGDGAELARLKHRMDSVLPNELFAARVALVQSQLDALLAEQEAHKRGPEHFDLKRRVREAAQAVRQAEQERLAAVRELHLHEDRSSNLSARIARLREERVRLLNAGPPLDGPFQKSVVRALFPAASAD